MTFCRGNRSIYRCSFLKCKREIIFVFVAQAFQKVSALKAMAPTQSEAPFVITQLVVMALFVLLGIFAVKGFHAKLVRGAVAFG